MVLLLLLTDATARSFFNCCCVLIDPLDADAAADDDAFSIAGSSVTLAPLDADAAAAALLFFDKCLCNCLVLLYSPALAVPILLHHL